MPETQLEAQAGRTEHSADVKRTVWKAEWIGLAVVVLTTLGGITATYAVMRYQTTQNTSDVSAQRLILSNHEMRISKAEVGLSDARDQLNRIEDNSREAIGLPPRIHGN